MSAVAQVIRRKPRSGEMRTHLMMESQTRHAKNKMIGSSMAAPTNGVTPKFWETMIVRMAPVTKANAKTIAAYAAPAPMAR